MIGVDTNVLVRAIVADNPGQTRTARELLAAQPQDDPAFASLVVIVELIWVLKRGYGFDQLAIHQAVIQLLESGNIELERSDLVEAALTLAAAKKTDIADSLIASIALEAGATNVLTFDRDAAKRIPGMELLK